MSLGMIIACLLQLTQQSAAGSCSSDARYSSVYLVVLQTHIQTSISSRLCLLQAAPFAASHCQTVPLGPAHIWQGKYHTYLQV